MLRVQNRRKKELLLQLVNQTCQLFEDQPLTLSILVNKDIIVMSFNKLRNNSVTIR